MQVNAVSFQSCVRELFRKEGIQGFYRGFSSPFIAQGLYKSVIFSTNSFVQRNLFHSSRSNAALFASGLISGSVNAWVVAPVEIVRTSLILAERDKQSASLFTTIRNITSQRGISGLWKGLLPAVARDGLGMGFYFLAFDKFKTWLSASDNSVSLGARIFAGAMAGAAFWVVALPVDTIKTVVEAQTISASTGSKTAGNRTNSWKLLTSVTQQLLNEGGVARLYRAWPMAFGRGLPSAAITLTTYDMCMNMILERRRDRP
jgi:solute carrier family 25 carnitine/acylcarnitine transporter 20/29